MARFTRLLSIDGGGIRGIIAGQVLAHLELCLRRRVGSEARLADIFDLFAGTSTGGILTCAYLCPVDAVTPRPRFTAAQAVDFYLEHGGEIFNRSIWRSVRTGLGVTDERYDAAGLERVLNARFEDVRLSQLLKPCLVAAYDIERRAAHFFTQHDAHRPGKDFYVRDIARATSAAPTYFEAAQIYSVETRVPYPLIDGGVFANNPALCAYAEARASLPRHARAKDMVILSLGTGSCIKPYRYDDVKDYGMLRWAQPLLDIMMTGVAETVDYQLAQIFSAVGAPHQYLRLNADLRGEPASIREMDNASPRSMERLRELGQALAEKHHEDLERLLDLLLLEGDASQSEIA